MAGRKTGGLGREVHSGRAKKAEKRKPMKYQTSLDWAGRLGAKLTRLERKDLPR